MRQHASGRVRAPRARNESGTSGVRARTTPHHILVVDDSMMLPTSVAALLQIMGYSTTEVGGGGEALAALRTLRRPDLILLDLNVPDISGWDLMVLLSRMKEFSTIPLVIMGTHEISEWPGVTFLRKPVDVHRLLATVGDACARGAA